MGEVASGRGRHYTVSAIAPPVYSKGPVQEAFFEESPLQKEEGWWLPVVGEGGSFCWAKPEARCTQRPRATRENRPLVCPSCPAFAPLGVLSLEGVPRSLEGLLPLLAQLTALALKNGRLFTEREEALAHLRAQAEALAHVNQVARDVARLLQPEGVLELLARALKERFGFYRVTVALVRGDLLEGHLTLRGDEFFWTEGQSQIRFPLATSADPLVQALRQRKTLLLPREALPERARSGVGPNVAVVPPLEEEALGVFSVDRGPGGRPVGEEEVGYLELLAGIVAVALKNAQLYRERGRLSLALAAERGRLVRIPEELPDGVVVLLGEEGFANRRAREILGLGERVVLSHLPAQLGPALEGGRLEVLFQGVTYSVRGRRVGEMRVLVLHDISERAKLERALREEARFTQGLSEMAQAALAERGLARVAEALAARLTLLFGADRALFLVEEAGGLRSLSTGEEVPRPNLLEQALEEGRPLPLEEGARGRCGLAETAEAKGLVVAPFAAPGFRGGLALVYRKPRRFGERFLSRVAQAANLAALALEKARFLDHLEAEEERLKALLENAQDVIYVLDGQGLLRFVSESARAVLGYDPEEVKALGAWDHVHPEDRPRAQNLLAELLACPGEVRRAELKVLYRDGTPIPVEA